MRESDPRLEGKAEECGVVPGVSRSCTYPSVIEGTAAPRLVS